MLLLTQPHSVTRTLPKPPTHLPYHISAPLAFLYVAAPSPSNPSARLTPSSPPRLHLWPPLFPSNPLPLPVFIPSCPCVWRPWSDRWTRARGRWSAWRGSAERFSGTWRSNRSSRRRCTPKWQPWRPNWSELWPKPHEFSLSLDHFKTLGGSV